MRGRGESINKGSATYEQPCLLPCRETQTRAPVTAVVTIVVELADSSAPETGRI